MDKFICAIVGFVATVLGTFGASWATFAAIDVFHKHFIDANRNLLGEVGYAKVALSVSTILALLSLYLYLKNEK